jgi:oligosaccharide repeat unit polymerase
MSGISIICFIFLLVLIASLFKKGTDFFSPARLFTFVWLVAIGLVDLKLSRFQKQWSIYGWVVMLLPLVSILIGMFVVYAINFGRPVYSIQKIRNMFTDYKFNSDLFYKVITGLFFAYLISYLVSYLVIGYIPLFTRVPDIVRSTWGIFGFGLLIQSIPAILFLMVIHFILVKNKNSKKLLLFIMFSISLITYLFLLQRYQLMMPAIFSVAFIFYTTDKLKLRNIILIILALALFMYGISTFRVSRYALHFIYYVSQMKYNIKYEIFTEPYMYVVMNLENFVHGVLNLQNFSYGVFSFDFILALTGLKYPLHEYLNLADYPNLLTSSFNTYTMFFIYFRDFGIIGLTVLPFSIGFLFSSSYYKMRIRPNINTIATYSLFVFVILFSFFVPIVSYLNFFSNLFLVYFITKLCITDKTEDYSIG